jgi:hypothetical protein
VQYLFISCSFETSEDAYASETLCAAEKGLLTKWTISPLVERLYFCAEDMPRCVGIAGQSSQIIHHLFDQDEFNTDSITSH